MIKKFFIKETLTEILQDMINSNDWEFHQSWNDGVFHIEEAVLADSNMNLQVPGDTSGPIPNCQLGSRRITEIRELQRGQKYYLIDLDYNATAHLTFTEQGFRIQTSHSGFMYEFRRTNHLVPIEDGGGKRFLIQVTYKGAKNGFLNQTLFPRITPWDIEL